MTEDLACKNPVETLKCGSDAKTGSDWKIWTIYVNLNGPVALKDWPQQLHVCRSIDKHVLTFTRIPEWRSTHDSAFKASINAGGQTPCHHLRPTHCWLPRKNKPSTGNRAGVRRDDPRRSTRLRANAEKLHSPKEEGAEGHQLAANSIHFNSMWCLFDYGDLIKRTRAAAL